VPQANAARNTATAEPAVLIAAPVVSLPSEPARHHRVALVQLLPGRAVHLPMELVVDQMDMFVHQETAVRNMDTVEWAVHTAPQGVNQHLERVRKHGI
jgi:hypothetical protein